MRRTYVTAGILAITAASSLAQADIFHDYENLSEGFLGTTYSQTGVTYRDVNNVSGVQPDGITFSPGELGDNLVIEDATLFFDDFPTYGSADKVLTFGNAFVNGDNLSIGALASVYMDIAGGGIAASFDIAYYENGPWGGIVYHLDALQNGNVVASDTFTLANGGGRDNPAWQTMSVSGATFDTLHLYATLNGNYTGPRGMIDNLSITSPVPEPASMAALALGAAALVRRRRK